MNTFRWYTDFYYCRWGGHRVQKNDAVLNKEGKMLMCPVHRRRLRTHCLRKNHGKKQGVS